MKKQIIVLLVILAAGLVVASGCQWSFDFSSDSNENSAPEKPASANYQGDSSTLQVYYTFGAGEQNVLDTKNNSYKKYLSCDDKTETYTLELSDTDRELIASAVTENDFFNLAGEYTENCSEEDVCQVSSDYEESRLTVDLDGETKTVQWTNTYQDPENPEYKNLLAVAQALQNVIQMQESELDIPGQDCLYF